MENLRREGFELCVGKPEVIIRKVDGLRQEPIEMLVIDCPIDCQNSVMSLLGERRTEMLRMESKDIAPAMSPIVEKSLPDSVSDEKKMQYKKISI